VLRFRGRQIAMQVQGDGPALLLINGMNRPSQSWEAFTGELSRLSGRAVITFDAPGVGGSPPALFPLSIPGHAALAEAALDAAGFDQVDILGFSHGGAVAQQLAHDIPDRVRRLVLVATSCGVGATPSAGQAIVRTLSKSADDAWQLAEAWSVFSQSLAISSWSSIAFLGGITSPTLVVCGTHDGVVAPANARVLAGRIPGAELVMVPGGHDLQKAEPAKALARAVEDFLAADRTSAVEQPWSP